MVVLIFCFQECLAWRARLLQKWSNSRTYSLSCTRVNYLYDCYEELQINWIAQPNSIEWVSEPLNEKIKDELGNELQWLQLFALNFLNLYAMNSVEYFQWNNGRKSMDWKHLAKDTDSKRLALRVVGCSWDEILTILGWEQLLKSCWRAGPFDRCVVELRPAEKRSRIQAGLNRKSFISRDWQSQRGVLDKSITVKVGFDGLAGEISYI